MNKHLTIKMIVRCCTLGRRNIHFTTNVSCQFKFSVVETDIPSAADDGNKDGLKLRNAKTETRTNKLQLGRQLLKRNGYSLDEILNFGGLSTINFNQFCTSILDKAEVAQSENDDFVKKSRLRSYTFPPMSTKLVRHINTFTSVHCGVAGLSWSTFKILPNESTKLTHWDWRALPESKLNLYQLAAFMSNALKDVPKSDFYVFENPNSPNVGSTSKINLNVQISQMIGMASVIAAQHNTIPISADDGIEPGTINVAYLRKFLFARLFRLYVGTERISTTSCVEDLIRLTNISGVMDKNVQTIVDVDLSLKSMYSMSDSRNKDFMGCSFLLGLAFLRLSLLKCPESAKLVTK